MWSDFLLEDQFHDDRYLRDLRWPAVHESNLYVSITLNTGIVLNFCSILRNRGQNREELTMIEYCYAYTAWQQWLRQLKQ